MLRRRAIREVGGPWASAMLTAIAAIAAQGVGGCCLIRPPNADVLLGAGEAGLRTPESAFELFRAAFASDLPLLEYRSLSQGFRRANGLSYQTYREARAQLLDRQPFMAFLAKAQVVDSVATGEGRHRLTVEAVGRRFYVDLVREDEFQMFSGGRLLADGPIDFPAALRVDPVGDGVRVRADLRLTPETLSAEPAELESASSLRLERRWRIDAFVDAPEG